jgi:hypothetical protein
MIGHGQHYKGELEDIMTDDIRRNLQGKYGHMTFTEICKLFSNIKLNSNQMENEKSNNVTARVKIDEIQELADNLYDRSSGLHNRLYSLMERLHGDEDTEGCDTASENVSGSMDVLLQKLSIISGVIDDCHTRVSRIEQAV